MSSSAASPRRGPGFFYWLFQAIPYAVLYAIAVVLVAMTETNAPGSLNAWLKFVPLVAAVSIVLGWKGGGYSFGFLFRQILHWGGLAVIIYYVLGLPEVVQFLPNGITGFTILCLLGLTAYLAGVYSDWRMMVFGASLIASAVGIAYLDNWSLILAGAGAAIILVTLFLHRLLRRFS